VNILVSHSVAKFFADSAKLPYGYPRPSFFS
jgi:hypothetical protein